MNCPICRSLELQPLVLEPTLSAQTCPQCAGIFISSGAYWSWLDQHGDDLPEQADPDPIPLQPEPARAKQCPDCQHVMLPFQITLDLPFTIDHCGACNGMWFDRDEWMTLRRRNLHDDLHRMFSAPWQRRLREAHHRQVMQGIYEKKFGAEDYAELRRVKAWLDAHPEREALRAYLNAEDPYQR